MEMKYLSVWLLATSVLIAGSTQAAEGFVQRLIDDSLQCGNGYPPESAWVEKSKIKWNPEVEKIPLGPSDAQRIAGESLKKYFEASPVDIWDASWRIVKSGSGNCYAVNLVFWWKGRGMLGTPLWTCVHVRMDGEARVYPTLLVTPPPDGLFSKPEPEFEDKLPKKH
jgi:hypothetical protein